MHPKLIQSFRAAYGRLPEIVTRAPGRIEFIGNHTDYNGGQVLGAAIDRGIWVGLAGRSDGLRRFSSDQHPDIVETAANRIEPLSGRGKWVNYPLGVLSAFPEFGLQAPEGFDYMAVSDLPAGAGLSSSAALEMASGLAFLESTDQRIPTGTLVKVARHAENNFVGVPCGILDQAVCGFGLEGHLVFIDCKGPEFATEPLGKGANIWIFNTHARHSLIDGLYAERHRECIDAAAALGLRWLSEASPAMLDECKGRLTATGYRRARHVTGENARVEETVKALRSSDLAAAGRLLTASHRSSQTLFENSTPELNFLVDTLGHAAGVYGARLTGGGFGGAVMALTDASFGQARATGIASAYSGRFGAWPEVLKVQTANGAERIV